MAVLAELRLTATSSMAGAVLASPRLTENVGLNTMTLES